MKGKSETSSSMEIPISKDQTLECKCTNSRGYSILKVNGTGSDSITGPEATINGSGDGSEDVYQTEVDLNKNNLDLKVTINENE